MTTGNDPRNTQPTAHQVIQVVDSARSSQGRWDPLTGEEATALLARLDLAPEAKETLLREALGILSRCPEPSNADASTTGLVIGHVQSGKTMNFTTVAALARDNGYRMIVVITGISTVLFDQSYERLKTDLQVGERYWKWQLFPNPDASARSSIEATLRDWTNPTVQEGDRQTVLITVMKNWAQLRKLNSLLTGMDLRGVPVLVVDDEADQAGLNTAVSDGQMSTTYRRLVQLRALLPHHAYLQYTATPQAPLLINIIDMLSPKFAELLTPGRDYAGGREFFIDNARNLVRTIPPAEVPTRDTPLTGIPNSLLEALRIFYLGVAAEMLKLPQQRRLRSMLVHPSQYVMDHADFATWVRQTQALWASLLSHGAEDEDRTELLNSFRPAFDDLRTTVPGLPTFDELAPALQRAVDRTIIWEMNARGGQGTPLVVWERSVSHILVGGQAMDRGFTVKGLTVSYMPRGIGTGQADTIQQRARFLGYKRPYIGFCRVFLEQAAFNAYRSYVEHEEDIHRLMERHRQTNLPLTEWRRRFFLDGALRPTRDKVIDIQVLRGNFADAWFKPSAPHDPPDAIEQNRAIVRAFRDRLGQIGLDFQEDAENQFVEGGSRHRVARTVSLSTVFTELLVPFRYGRPGDSQNYTGLLLQVERYLREHPQETCTVYLMSAGSSRLRSLTNENTQVNNIFQPPSPADGSRYRGDDKVHASASLTVQIHYLNLKPEEAGASVLPDVVAVAVWVPRAMSGPWVHQAQGQV